MKKLSLADFSMFKSMLSCLIFIHSKDSIEEMVDIMKDIWDTTIWDFDNLTWNGCPTHK